MFERFSDHARRVLIRSQEVAREGRHDSIKASHMLVALTRETGSTAAGVLGTLNITESRLLELIPVNDSEAAPAGQIPFPESKKLFEHALRQALKLGCNYIGTEHLLLAIVTYPSDEIEHLLAGLDTSSTQVRATTVDYLQEHGKASPEDPVIGILKEPLGETSFTGLTAMEALSRLLQTGGLKQKLAMALIQRDPNLVEVAESIIDGYLIALNARPGNPLTLSRCTRGILALEELVNLIRVADILPRLTAPGFDEALGHFVSLCRRSYNEEMTAQ